MAAESDVNEQSLSTNAQSGTRKNMQTIAENLSLAGGTSEAQATQLRVFRLSSLEAASHRLSMTKEW